MSESLRKAFKERRRGSGKIVRRTEEFRRIEELPRRTSYQDFSKILTEFFRAPGGTEELRMAQAWAIYEAAEAGGLVALFPVGEGKTLLSVLLGAVWDVAPIVLIMPAKAVNETIKIKLPQMRRHWRFHEPELISYEKLALSQYSDFLSDKRPRAIVCDEAHKLRRKNSVRRRIERYLNEFPDTHYAGLSGSLVEESIRDYGHVLEMALGEDSPLPRTWGDLDDWAGALDDGVGEDERVQSGALENFCDEGESVRSGYRRRLLETRGVCVVLSPTAINASLIIRETHPKVPKSVEKALGHLRGKWETPGGEVMTSALEFARHAREIALGFYYRWVWPEGKIDFEWLDARRAWRGYVRHVIRYSQGGQFPYDTEKQVRDACAAGILRPPENEFEAWFAIEKRSDPQTECVWISDFIVKFGVKWIAQANKNIGKDKALAGVLWVGHKALLEAFEKKGIPVYGGGAEGILEETRSCVASLDAHGEAKNLQYQFSQACYLVVRRSGQKWEQSLGRFHRSGQPADEVVIDVPLHTIERWEAFEGARGRAAYQQETTGLRQKLCYGTVDVRDPSEISVLKQSKSPLWDKEHDWAASERDA